MSRWYIVAQSANHTVSGGATIDGDSMTRAVINSFCVDAARAVGVKSDAFVVIFFHRLADEEPVTEESSDEQGQQE